MNNYLNYHELSISKRKARKKKKNNIFKVLDKQTEKLLWS